MIFVFRQLPEAREKCEKLRKEENYERLKEKIREAEKSVDEWKVTQNQIGSEVRKLDREIKSLKNNAAKTKKKIVEGVSKFIRNCITRAQTTNSRPVFLCFSGSQ